MATRKKQDIALQQEVETQEEWEEMLTREGLIVVDVYQEWCGPCKAMQSNFRKAKNELGDEFIKFAVAKADSIDALERYRGKCEPCFLFYAGGCLVAVVRGANGPVLSRTLLTELQKEKKVLEGVAERVEIRDPAFSHLDKQAVKDEDDDMEAEDEAAAEEEDLVPKEVTVAIIKPDVVAAGKVDAVLEKMKAAGIEILKHEERQLSDAEARQFYSHLSSSDFYEELVRFMCSGTSHVLVLSKPVSAGRGIISEWRELLGPKNVEEAKAAAPGSWRAEFGTSSLQNALHGSDSNEASARELAFFFPGFSIPKVQKSEAAKTGSMQAPSVQRTLALIRPDALIQHKDAIMQKINEAGFTIAMQKEVQLSREQAMDFYKEHKEQPYFEEMIDKMTCGPLLALGLAREDAISTWRTLLGPKEVEKAKTEQPQSLRAQFAVANSSINMLHGSDSAAAAQKELNMFFPPEETVAVIKPEAYENRDVIMEKIKEAGFHIAARKETTITKEMAEMLYSNCSGKEFYNDLVNHMTSGPTLFMVLSKEDAVQNWRGLMGATDPEKAKAENPDSIRAVFGKDIKANAVHGASTQQDAAKVIKVIFGDEGAQPAPMQQGSDEGANDDSAAGNEREESSEAAAGDAANAGEDTHKDGAHSPELSGAALKAEDQLPSSGSDNRAPAEEPSGTEQHPGDSAAPASDAGADAGDAQPAAAPASDAGADAGDAQPAAEKPAAETTVSQ